MWRFLRGVRQCVRESWDGMWRNLSLTLLSAVSVGISLYVLGLFLLLAYNLDRFVQDLGRGTQVQIYLREDVTQDQMRSLRSELSSDPAIAEVQYLSKDDARQRFQRDFPTLRDLPERVGGNPFPASFELQLKDTFREPAALDRIAKSYHKAAGVEEVRYDRGWTERLAALVGLARKGGLALGALLAFAALVTVGATVRLSVAARSDEIEIMKLVGATAAFIRAPFLLAAAAQGLAGGGLAVAGLYVTHRLVERTEIYSANPFVAMVVGRFLPSQVSLTLAVGGAALGLVATFLSLRRAGTF